MHWIWQMRESMVCESLLGQSLLNALKGGAAGVYEAAIQVDPRVLGHGGRPRYGYGWNDPGELSGTVWYIEGVLDVEFFRAHQSHEDGRAARESYHKVVRGHSSIQDTLSRQDRAYNLAQVLGNFWLSDESRTDELFRAVGFNEKQQQEVLIHVGGDRSRYPEIKELVRNVYVSSVGSVGFVDGAASSGGNLAPAKTWATLPATPPHSYAGSKTYSSPVPSGIGGEWDQSSPTMSTIGASVSEACSPEPSYTFYGAPATAPGAPEGWWTEEGAWIQEVPCWFQDWYTGAYWSTDTGGFDCEESELKEWDDWNQASPEQGQLILAAFPAETCPVVEEEQEPEERSGSYWLPIYFGKGGKGKGKGGKGKGGG